MLTWVLGVLLALSVMLNILHARGDWIIFLWAQYQRTKRELKWHQERLAEVQAKREEIQAQYDSLRGRIIQAAGRRPRRAPEGARN